MDKKRSKKYSFVHLPTTLWNFSSWMWTYKAVLDHLSTHISFCPCSFWTFWIWVFRTFFHCISLHWQWQFPKDKKISLFLQVGWKLQNQITLLKHKGREESSYYYWLSYLVHHAIVSLDFNSPAPSSSFFQSLGSWFLKE